MAYLMGRSPDHRPHTPKTTDIGVGRRRMPRKFTIIDLSKTGEGSAKLSETVDIVSLEKLVTKAEPLPGKGQVGVPGKRWKQRTQRRG